MRAIKLLPVLAFVTFMTSAYADQNLVAEHQTSLDTMAVDSDLVEYPVNTDLSKLPVGAILRLNKKFSFPPSPPLVDGSVARQRQDIVHRVDSRNPEVVHLNACYLSPIGSYLNQRTVDLDEDLIILSNDIVNLQPAPKETAKCNRETVRRLNAFKVQAKDGEFSIVCNNVTLNFYPRYTNAGLGLWECDDYTDIDNMSDLNGAIRAFYRN